MPEKEWSERGNVLKRLHDRSYLIQTDAGSYARIRRHLLLTRDPPTDGLASGAAPWCDTSGCTDCTCSGPCAPYRQQFGRGDDDYIAWCGAPGCTGSCSRHQDDPKWATLLVSPFLSRGRCSGTAHHALRAVSAPSIGGCC